MANSFSSAQSVSSQHLTINNTQCWVKERTELELCLQQELKEMVCVLYLRMDTILYHFRKMSIRKRHWHRDVSKYGEKAIENTGRVNWENNFHSSYHVLLRRGWEQVTQKTQGQNVWLSERHWDEEVRFCLCFPCEQLLLPSHSGFNLSKSGLANQ